MSVSERDSGIVSTHISAIEATAKAENTFIFIRPTEYDSTVLIKAGFATKSMDIHHKSSNWGPMAGFVPCDPAFSKKCEGAPNPEEDEHPHGDAQPVHLALPPKLVDGHEKIDTVDGLWLEFAESSSAIHKAWRVKRKSQESSVKSLKSRFEAVASSGPRPPLHKFCKAVPAGFGNKATLFCLVEKAGSWLVYWVLWDGDNGRLIPLRVFGYSQDGSVNPVTGDYDLWMVAPHFKHFDSHSLVRIEQDSHGSSAASGFTVALLQKMNVSCGRAKNPVFNHGAEAQNYGFTQALDWNLAMFTPAGTSRMVRMGALPGILADLQCAGYLVVWNKRYGEIDPNLMGSPDKRGMAKMSDLKNTLDDLYSQLIQFRSSDRSAIASFAQSNGRMHPTMQQEIGLMASRFEASRSLGLEQARIYRFTRSLMELLDAQRMKLQVLTAADLAPDARLYTTHVMQLHSSLQRAMVSATTGSGQSNEAQLQKWLSDHRTELEQIKTYWT